MSRGFRMGGAAAKPSTLSIYDSGSWAVAYDNTPRSFLGYSSNPFTLASDRMYNSMGTACISTATAIDLSEYTTLHILIERTNANNVNDGICVSSSNSFNDSIANVVFNNLVANSPVEVTLDISAITSGYIVLHCDTTMWTVYKIWAD